MLIDVHFFLAAVVRSNMWIHRIIYCYWWPIIDGIRQDTLLLNLNCLCWPVQFYFPRFGKYDLFLCIHWCCYMCGVYLSVLWASTKYAKRLVSLMWAHSFVVCASLKYLYIDTTTDPQLCVKCRIVENCIVWEIEIKKYIKTAGIKHELVSAHRVRWVKEKARYEC